MYSLIGRNAQRCCDTVGLSWSNLHAFNKELGFHVVYSSLPDWVALAVHLHYFRRVSEIPEIVFEQFRNFGI